jgi:hypothetical protein
VSHNDKRERSTLERLERLRRHTKVIGEILRDLWPLVVVMFSILGVTLHQLG